MISDHGNYAGLLAVLADIGKQQCDRILCLGDLVDGGSQSIEVVRLFQKQSIQTVQGNKVSATFYPIPYDEEFPFAADDRYRVCVGSIGYSRDAYNWLRCAIFDSERDSITFKAPDGPILAKLLMVRYLSSEQAM